MVDSVHLPMEQHSVIAPVAGLGIDANMVSFVAFKQESGSVIRAGTSTWAPEVQVW